MLKNARVRISAALVLFAGAGLLAGQGQQQEVPQGPTFKAQVEYVEVDAVVTDDELDETWRERLTRAGVQLHLAPSAAGPSPAGSPSTVSTEPYKDNQETA